MLYISETVKRLRKEKNMTQEELAAVLGVSCQAISRWENSLAYPDIELLPQISAFFDVDIDSLFGTDKEREAQKVQEYLKTLPSDIDACIAHTQRYLDALPRSAYLKYRLMKLYQVKGLAFAQSKLETMRKLCYGILDAEVDKAWLKSAAVAIMISVEDDSGVQDWLAVFSNTQTPMDAKAALINRYQYRKMYKKYNKAIQEDIAERLNYIFVRDFCKMDAEGGKDPASRAAGQKTVLALVDTLRDPNIEIDGWIETRAFAYLRLSAGEFGCGNMESGYQALADAVRLYIAYATLPQNTQLKYNHASLDEICFVKTKSCHEILSEVYACLTDPGYGWDWFAPVRESEKFVERIKPIKKLL